MCIKKLIFACAFISSISNAYAQSMPKSCWVIDGMEGISMVSDTNYKIVPDRVREKMIILFDGDNSFVSSHNQPLVQIDDYMLMGATGGPGEIDAGYIYHVDPIKRKAFLSRIKDETTRSSSGILALVGNAIPCG